MATEVEGYKIIRFNGKLPSKDLESMIFSDMMKSLRYGNEWFEAIDATCYYDAYEKLISHLMQGIHTILRLAVLSSDSDTCLGWSMSAGNKLHYVYVKEAFRKQGIGTALLPATFNEITHLTKLGQAMRKASFPDVIFNPF